MGVRVIAVAPSTSSSPAESSTSGLKSPPTLSKSVKEILDVAEEAGKYSQRELKAAWRVALESSNRAEAAELREKSAFEDLVSQLKEVRALESSQKSELERAFSWIRTLESLLDTERAVLRRLEKRSEDELALMTEALTSARKAASESSGRVSSLTSSLLESEAKSKALLELVEKLRGESVEEKAFSRVLEERANALAIERDVSLSSLTQSKKELENLTIEVAKTREILDKMGKDSTHREKMLGEELAAFNKMGKDSTHREKMLEEELAALRVRYENLRLEHATMKSTQDKKMGISELSHHAISTLRGDKEALEKDLAAQKSQIEKERLETTAAREEAFAYRTRVAGLESKVRELEKSSLERNSPTKSVASPLPTARSFSSFSPSTPHTSRRSALLTALLSPASIEALAMGRLSYNLERENLAEILKNNTEAFRAVSVFASRLEEMLEDEQGKAEVMASELAALKACTQK